MRRYQYWRLHLPTGEKTLGAMDAPDTLTLLRSLNAYNRQMPGLWQYWVDENQISGRLIR